MIEREAGERGEEEMELYVGEGEGRVNLVNLKSRMMYECLRKGEVRRPAGEKVWKRVMNDMNVERMWMNMRVKWNSIECEHFDFLVCVVWV